MTISAFQPGRRSAQVLVATGDGGTDRLYRFPRFLLPSAHHMCLFEHVEGCRFCETLFGHYLLPSGALAHFYLGDTVVKVRQRGRECMGNELHLTTMKFWRVQDWLVKVPAVR